MQNGSRHASLHKFLVHPFCELEGPTTFKVTDIVGGEELVVRNKTKSQGDVSFRMRRREFAELSTGERRTGGR
jgi:hypothetical protein